MIAALVTLDLHIGASTSLKAKRAVVKGLVAELRNNLNCSVVEVDHQDLWQRAVLGIAIAAGSEVGARKVAQQAEKLVYRNHRVEVLAVHVEIVGPEV
jgi:uncharacterized protein